MLRSLHTICLALLLPSLGTVRGKQCYDCTVVSGSKDQCGNFDQWTPKCNVASDGDCLKSTIQGPGQEIVVHSCDVLPVCPGQRDECLQENGNSVCCCHGDLCNSSSLQSGSVLLLLSTLSFRW